MNKGHENEVKQEITPWNVDPVSIRRALLEAEEKLNAKLKRDGTVTAYDVADALGISIDNARRLGFGD